MKELINELVSKVGLNEETAAKAVETTLGFVKGKVPPIFADKVEDLMNGNFDISSLLSGLTGEGNKDGDNNPLDKLKGLFS